MSPPDGTNVAGDNNAGAGGAAGGGGVDGAANGAAAGANGAANGGASGAGDAGNAGAGAAAGAGNGAAAGGAAAAGAGEAAKPAWADDWRKTMAKGDDAAVKRLERYKDPEAVFEALVNAQKKIDSGVIKSKLPDNATPEQVAEYRKENGIPETPDKYDLALPNGVVIGEADKPLVDSFLNHMHGENATPAEVKRGLAWWHKQNEALRVDNETKDAVFKQESTAELGKRYGGDFKRNIAHVDRFLEEFPPGVKEKVLGARLPNGRLAGSDPDYIDFLYQQALFRNPIATVMGGNSEAQVKAGETRLNELIKLSGDPNSEYNKGPTREKLRQEHLDLIDSLQKVKAAGR